jgi:hypothetical protein
MTGDSLRKSLTFNRAGSRNRTGDLLITSQLLYQLSYAGLKKRGGHYMRSDQAAN